MPFHLNVAADLYGVKVNLELEFPQFPTVADVIATAQAVFSYESSVLRPPHLPLQTFSVSRLQIYRDDEGTWHDVVSPSQFREFGQLYIIQGDPSFQESRQQILPARKPSRPQTTPGIMPSSPAGIASPYRGPSSLSGVPTSPVRPPVTVAATATSGASYHSMPRATSPPRSAASHHVSAAAASPSAAAHISAAALQRYAPRETVAAHEKIRFVFEEMDRNGNRLIEPEEFREMLRGLNIDFSSATVTDLFRKADVDRDGVLSMAEFTQFFSAYTTLLDSLYYRLRDIAEARQLQTELSGERGNLDSCLERRARSIQMIQESSAIVDQQAHKLRNTEGDRAIKAARENELRNLMGQCDEDLRLAAAQRTDASNDYELQRQRESQAQNLGLAAQRDSSEAERRVVNDQNQLQAAQEKERQLQALLLEAQREVERQHKLLYDAQLGLAQTRDREKAAFMAIDAAQKDLQRSNDRLSLCEREVILKNERQKELNKVLGEVQLELQRLAQRVDDDRRDLAACEDRDRHNRQLAQDADAAVHLQERTLHEKDQEIILFSQRRAAMELQEKPLLEQEVRLREQRDNLEEKEIRLRREAVNYFDGSRAVPGSATGGGNPSASSPMTTFRSVSPPRR